MRKKDVYVFIQFYDTKQEHMVSVLLFLRTLKQKNCFDEIIAEGFPRVSTFDLLQCIKF